MEESGNWLAENVPVRGTDSIQITVNVETPAGQFEELVSNLARSAELNRPLAVARGFEEGHVVLHYGTDVIGEFREWDEDGREVHRYRSDVQGAYIYPHLESWPATGEVVALSSTSEAACRVVAYHLQEQTERELIRFEWTEGSNSGCEETVRFVASSEHLLVVNLKDQELLAINTAGNFVSRSNFDADLTQWGDTLQSPDGPTDLLYLQEAPYAFNVRRELLSLEVESGSQIGLYIGQGLDDNIKLERPLSARVGANYYFWLEGRPIILDSDSRVEYPLGITGFTPTEVIHVNEAEEGHVYNLDMWGRLSTTQADTGVTALVSDSDPYYHPPLQLFDTPDHSRQIVIGTSHVMETSTSFRFGMFLTFKRPWTNLFTYDLKTNRMETLYTSSSHRGNLNRPLGLQGLDFVISRDDAEFPSVNQPPSISLVNLETGESAPLRFRDLVSSEKYDVVAGLDGEFIAFANEYGLFDYNLDSQLSTRALEFTESLSLPTNPVLRARFPGEDGAIYLTDQPMTALYRADFERNGVIEVSGVNHGSGPDLPSDLSSIAFSWEPAEKVAYLIEQTEKKIWRIDLSSGDRSVLFDYAGSDQYELPETITSVKVLDGEETALATGVNSLYYLDLVTGASVAVPLYFGD